VEGVLESTTIGFGHLHLFPNPFRPRVIVLDILPQDDLTLLSGLIAKGIQTSGYELDSRPFHAHLTLGRIKQPQEVDLSFVTEKSSQPEMNDIDVSEVVLFRSEPQSDGNVYSVLERIVLEKKTMMG
jgi:2'-5' RNA ligase